MTASDARRSRAHADDRTHILHSWSSRSARDAIVVAGGEGAWFWDEDGRRYLDFASQMVNLSLGHQHPRLVAAIVEQAGTLATIAPTLASEARSEAAHLIAERAPGDLDVVFFTNGGAEATENAVRIARHHTGRHKVLTAYRSYHGATAGAVTLTGEPRRWGSEPGAPGVVRFLGPYLYRSPFHARSEAEEGERALAHLADVVAFEGPHTVAAVVVETVVGGNGILVPPDGYLAGVRELCDRHGILLVCDEVMAGFGRCGAWFAVDRWGVVPDLICFAKGVNSGYVPLGGVIMSQAVADTFRDRPYPGGLTYSGHPLACAAAVASIRAFEDEGVIERVRHLEADVLGPGLRELAARHPAVGDVRGLGCFWALELVRDRATREPLVPFAAAGPDAAPMAELTAACLAAGLYPLPQGNRLHVCPPLIVSDDDARRGLAILDDVLALADAHARG